MERKAQKTFDFTQGPILGPLLKFIVPIFLALALQALYGAVDLAIVGRFAETGDISAVANGADFMQMITFLMANLASGVTVLLGQKLGAGERGEAGKIVGEALVLFAIIMVIPTVLCTTLAGGICTILQVPEAAFEACTAYIRICSVGTVCIVAYNLIGSVFRGIGDSKMPLITVAISCVVNIAGDLLLVAVFHMGAAGAAIATVFAQGFSVVMSLIIMKKCGLPFDFNKSYIRFNARTSGMVLKLGAPIALQGVLVSISFLFVMALVNKMGLTESAGVGVAQKVTNFVQLLPNSFSQAMAAFVAQNTGARQMSRARRGMAYGMMVSGGIGVFIATFIIFKGELVASIFASDPAVLAQAGLYLRAFAIECVLTSVMFNLVGYFSGQGKSVFVMVQGLIGGIGIRLPVAYLMSRLPETSVFYIGLATPCATLVQIVICFAYFAICLRKEKRDGLPDDNAVVDTAD